MTITHCVASSGKYVQVAERCFESGIPAIVSVQLHQFPFLTGRFSRTHLACAGRILSAFESATFCDSSKVAYQRPGKRLTVPGKSGRSCLKVFGALFFGFALDRISSESGSRSAS